MTEQRECMECSIHYKEDLAKKSRVELKLIFFLCVAVMLWWFAYGMLHWAERIITQISQESFDFLPKNSVATTDSWALGWGYLDNTNLINKINNANEEQWQLQQQQQSTSNSFTSFLSFEGHAYFYNTNNNDYRSNCFLFGQNDRIFNAKHRKRGNTRLKQRRKKFE